MLKAPTKVIVAKLQDICSNHNLIRREQFGFMKREECIAQVACLIERSQRRKLRQTRRNDLLISRKEFSEKTNQP